MNQAPLVSVITIFLNEDRFLEEAVASVIAQTYQHWELLLVDDGSTDRSAEIAQHYANQYPQKIRYLTHPHRQNKGMSATRNLGIQHARGDLITFLDGDDLYLPHKLERQVEILNAHPDVTMLYGQTMDWFGWSGRLEDRQRDLVYDLCVPTETILHPPILFNLCLRRQAPTPCTCSAILRREVFEGVGRFEESFRGLYEDQVFYMKVMLVAPIYVVHECWDKYRRHADSCNSLARSTGQDRALRYSFLTWLRDYLQHQPDVAPTVWQALEAELWPYRHPFLSRLANRFQGAIERLKSA